MLLGIIYCFCGLMLGCRYGRTVVVPFRAWIDY